eukprot:TRINITY_DN1099_c1_g2_i1.p1 TRINITY_DN1099_c1_g2~~TRINITY_DN1099_c1_g2_i1.p1  ORF type:complete len:240 (+),score=-15.30 TRINITY_DN1099_c1_g2_i1:281-1000(+)
MHTSFAQQLTRMVFYFFFIYVFYIFIITQPVFVQIINFYYAQANPIGYVIFFPFSTLNYVKIYLIKYINYYYSIPKDYRLQNISIIIMIYFTYYNQLYQLFYLSKKVEKLLVLLHTCFNNQEFGEFKTVQYSQDIYNNNDNYDIVKSPYSKNSQIDEIYLKLLQQQHAQVINFQVSKCFQVPQQLFNNSQSQNIRTEINVIITNKQISFIQYKISILQNDDDDVTRLKCGLNIQFPYTL